MMTDTAPIWREKMIDYNICLDDDCVNISVNDCNYVSSFMNIFIDSNITPSPFKDIEDAELFAEIMVKLLKVISNDIE